MMLAKNVRQMLIIARDLQAICGARIRCSLSLTRCHLLFVLVENYCSNEYLINSIDRTSRSHIESVLVYWYAGTTDLINQSINHAIKSDFWQLKCYYLGMLSPRSFYLSLSPSYN